MTTIDMSQHQQQEERTKAVAIKVAEGKELNICGLKITRGKPSPLTDKSLIGEDGKIDYFIVDTDCDLDGEGSTSFFGTSAIASQIKRVPNYEEAFAKGDLLGPAKIGKKQSKKTSGKYWCLLFPNESEY